MSRDNDIRNSHDFYAHRALVLKRIIQALAALKAEKRPRKK